MRGLTDQRTSLILLWAGAFAFRVLWTPPELYTRPLFSNGWKKRHRIFQGLERTGRDFPMVGKLGLAGVPICVIREIRG